MAVEFYGLAMLPGKAYKMSVPEHVELQINQACLGPDSTVRQARIFERPPLRPRPLGCAVLSGVPCVLRTGRQGDHADTEAAGRRGRRGRGDVRGAALDQRRRQLPAEAAAPVRKPLFLASRAFK